MEIYGLVAGKGGKGRISESLLSALNYRLPNAAVEVLLTGGPAAQAHMGGTGAKASEAEIVGFYTALHTLVDDWINSARNESADRPGERAIPIHLLQQYISRNPARLGLAAPGGPIHLLVAPHVFSQSDSVLRAHDAATGLFLQLMDSPARARLSRCDVCGTYFTCARTPKKDTPIFHGTFCEKHKGKGGAKRTAESRERRTKQMVELAAESWLKWKQKTQYGKRSKWVAAEMNKTVSRGGEKITGKWVTQHQKEIEAEIERRSHAKS